MERDDSRLLLGLMAARENWMGSWGGTSWLLQLLASCFEGGGQNGVGERHGGRHGIGACDGGCRDATQGRVTS